MFHVLHRFWRWLLARLGYCGGAHFLAGAPSLPPPLTPEQEKVLLARMAAGDAAARDDLITHNLRLVVYLAKKYESSGVPAEDMISIGTIGLIKAVNTFTPERSIKLATYASRCIGNEILMYLRKSSNRRQEASIDEPLNVDGDGNELLLSDILGSDENQISQRLARMAAGDAAARDDLITHNLRLVVYLAKKYESSGVPAEDMISIGTIGLIKAVNTFTPERSIKLATYASRCIGNEILMYLRKSSNRRQEASIDEPLNVDGDGNELLLSDILGSDENQISQRLEQDAERAVLRRAVDSLSPRERQIMELRFGLADGIERTQKEAADALGISQSYISRLEKRIIHTLKVQLENE